MRRSAGAAAIVLGLFAATGCQGSSELPRSAPPAAKRACVRLGELRAQVPLVEVDVPEATRLGFADAAAPDGTSVGRVTVSNACEGVLELQDLAIAGDSPPGTFSVGPVDAVLLTQDEAVTVSLVFSPPTDRRFEDRLLVSTNDPDAPMVELPLAGRGRAPRLEVTPPSVDHGPSLLGCEQSTAHTLRNVGSAELVVTEVDLVSDAIDAFSVDLDPLSNGPLPFRLGPGQELQIYTDYLALDALADVATARIVSNDPSQATALLSLRGDGIPAPWVSETFEVIGGDELDVLVVVDRETSERFRAPIVDQLDQLVTDMEVGFADLRLAAVVQDDGCITGRSRFVDPDMAGKERRHILEDMVRVELPPEADPGERAGLALAELALSPESVGPGGCNERFYREDAALAVVFISDADDRSPDGWAVHASRIQALKEERRRLSMNAVIGRDPRYCADAEAGLAYRRAAVGSGGMLASICDGDWGKAFVELPLYMGVQGFSLNLEEQSVPQTLEVYVDGVRKPLGWEMDISSNTIRFEAGHEPPSGSKVEVRYIRLPDCEG